MRPVSWIELRQICEAEGWQFDRQRGDHFVMTRAGMIRPVVIPMKNNLTENIVLSVMRTMEMDRNTLDRYLSGNLRKMRRQQIAQRDRPGDGE